MNSGKLREKGELRLKNERERERGERNLFEERESNLGLFIP